MLLISNSIVVRCQWTAGVEVVREEMGKGHRTSGSGGLMGNKKPIELL